MKKEFDKGKPVEFTDIAGLPVLVCRADIETVKPAPKESPANSLVMLKICDRHPAGGVLQLSEGVQKIIDVLNGVPAPELLRQWEDDIFEQRSLKIRERIKDLKFTLSGALREQARGYEKVVAAIRERAADIEVSLERSRKVVEQSPRLRRAIRWNDYADRFPPHSLRRQIIGWVADLHGRNGIEHAAYLSGNKDAPVKTRLLVDHVEHDHEIAKAKLRKECAVKIVKLRSAARDPQLSADDNHILAGKIERYRIEHAEAGFIFIRDPQSEVYRPQSDIEREQSAQRLERMRQRQSTRGHHPYAHER